MSDRKIGVYICHCGGNISDYVDVEKVREAVEGETGVEVAKTAMFACSDATQQEIIQDIKERQLDGIVVASCSPKLHLHTFREVAKRAGLNPYQYSQVNVREQCSWAHTDDQEGATKKAIRLVRAGIARTNLTEPLKAIVVDTVPRVLVIGAGIAGLRAAIGLSDIGISVFLVEKSPAAGGWVAEFEQMYPHGKNGKKIIGRLIDEVKRRDNIVLYTGAELVDKSGCIGNFEVTVRAGGPKREEIKLNVGSIIVATGFDAYRPPEGEYGYGREGVVTIAEFKKMLDASGGPIVYNGKRVKYVVYIYCVGSRQAADVENANRYCSRYCCNAAVHASVAALEKDPEIHHYHLFRDVRTYGKYELMYNEALRKGSTFIKFEETDPPLIQNSPGGRMLVAVKDLLTGGEELQIEADLVVLVTGMVPRKNDNLVDILKLPLGRDRFFNEIHPKLRPVETVVDGVFICGACQGPKNSSESVASALAAVTQSASILKKGYVELEPLIARVYQDRCDGCGVCVKTCPYSAIEMVDERGRKAAGIVEAVCKGCGGCAPVCPRDAIDLKGYSEAQIKSMIDGFLKEII
ncbi:MAG: CoB--CoM heterodisulfide reductase iron-sulfur subunit A family protein [Firmicutes bacterium]|nr:CoB--CoM heterodisulfide reductase iron-sulfur subunit A family protein [Bacillota bacterium]